MQLNKVYSVKTIDRVAAELGETVDRIFNLAIDMETEDGVIWVYGPGDASVIAFTPFGIENLQELIEMDREHAR
ncbi:hypothetical protein [Primorskyibacter flagellatus]|uniref:Uncharacterized protein n=1 Tax=Primorskyibacter flagellatus TaxID=1387277 RepID=A0A1W2E5N5_9RHOB|nr:hypothetical protein [Primorskyibacter flagellatus]SMD05060.1 hypothetical protein SAMN06295998_1237 [Primorskyibacter flagellatus]